MPDDGCLGAPLVLIGEAPGVTEDLKGRPFIGASGKWLEGVWALPSIGLSRSDFYVTNVWPRFPGRGADAIKSVPPALLDEAVHDLHDRLAALERPMVLVPTGNYALKALTGLTGVTKWRGSVLSYTDRRGRTIKVIPTLHPAAIMRKPDWEKRAIFDWQRIAGDGHFPELRLPERRHNYQPTLDDIDAWVAGIRRAAASGESPVVAFDIETPRDAAPADRHILCIGFSSRPSESLVVPTTEHHWGKARLRQEVWPRLGYLLSTPGVEWAAHNGNYDRYWLRRLPSPEGGHSVPLQWDTMLMHHALSANDNHGLAYCASIDTRQPYWKDEGKAWATPRRAAGAFEQLLHYNGLDACVTRELAGLYRTRLAGVPWPEGGRSAPGASAFGSGAKTRLDYYLERYQALLDPVLDMTCHGVRVDVSGRARLQASLLARTIRLQRKLTALAGRSLHAEKDLSNAKLLDFFYGKGPDGKPAPGKLALPELRDKKTKSRTLNEVALKKLAARHETAREPAALVLEHRGAMKLIAEASEGRVDEDGRLRASYTPTAESGRYRSNENPFGTGQNLQNIHEDIRHLMLPDSEHGAMVFVDLDLSAVHDRECKVMTGAARLIGEALTRPGTGAQSDPHSTLACRAFSLPAGTLLKKDDGRRVAAKMARHALNLDVHAPTLCESLLKMGHPFALDDVKRLVEAAAADEPEKLDWQRWVRVEMLNKRRLVTAMGRVWECEFARMAEDLYRQGYSFLLQGLEADLMNLRGFVPLWRWFKQREREVGHPVGAVNLHTHDGMTFSVLPEHAWEATAFFVRSMEQPVPIRTILDTTVDFIPFVEVKMGCRWGKPPGVPAGEKHLVSWPSLPGREEMTELAHLLARGPLAPVAALPMATVHG